MLIPDNNKQLLKLLLIYVCMGLTSVSSAQSSAVPEFELDTLWPEVPMRNNWLTGGLGGMCLGHNDEVYLLNRQNVTEADLDAAILAPPIVVLNKQGEVIDGWGDPELIGGRLHDCHVDSQGDVWIVAAATSYIQKYSSDGTLLAQIGESDVFDSSDGTRAGEPLNSDAARFFLPAAVDVNESTGEIFVADGELPGGNSRIAVFDSNGQFLRQWALYRGEDEKDLFAGPHCLRISNDGLVYVCDRSADRIQVFDQAGQLQQIIDSGFEPLTNPADRDSGERGTAVVLAFSNDSEQRYLYVVNQNSVSVEVLDRSSGALLTRFGNGPGRYRGQFELPHSIAVDSEGNIIIAEQEGRRVQKFKLLGSN
jgi:DNA-binding beta-propeller fold protein YncE